MRATKICIAAFLAASVLSACSTPEKQESSRLIINLTSDATENAHSSLMGLHFAEKALNNGMEVTVFLNVDSVKLLQSGGDTISFHDENIRQLLNSIVDLFGRCCQIAKRKDFCLYFSKF